MRFIYVKGRVGAKVAVHQGEGGFAREIDPVRDPEQVFWGFFTHGLIGVFQVFFSGEPDHVQVIPLQFGIKGANVLAFKLHRIEIVRQGEDTALPLLDLLEQPDGGGVFFREKALGIFDVLLQESAAIAGTNSASAVRTAAAKTANSRSFGCFIGYPPFVAQQFFHHNITQMAQLCCD